MDTDDKILKALDELRMKVEIQGERLESLQNDVTVVKADTGKIPAIEQRLEHHGKLLRASQRVWQLSLKNSTPSAAISGRCTQKSIRPEKN